MSTDDTFATRNDPLLVQTADGCPLPLQRLGVGGGEGAPAALLLAGGDGSMRWWRALLPALCRDEAERRLFAPLAPPVAFDAALQVVVWDARGGGRAGRGHGVAAPGPAAADALRIARGLFDRSVHLVGHGLGGAAAALAALEAPELVASLTLLATPLSTEGATAGELALGGPAAIGAALARGWAGRHAEVAAALMAEAEVAAGWSARLEEAGSAPRSALAELPDLRLRLAALERPLLVMQGARDTLVSPAQARDLASRAGAGVRLVELDGGHLLPIERAPEIAAAVAVHIAAAGGHRPAP